MTTYKNVTSTALGEKLGLPARKVNLMLKEAGWLTKNNDGWTATESGLLLGAQVKKYKAGRNTYVVWPADIVDKKAFQYILNHYLKDNKDNNGNSDENQDKINDKNDTHISRPPNYSSLIRTMDGHYVRSKSEAIIDDWLYTNEISHSYEKRLPSEEDIFCDFYLPKGNIYIEHWGLNTDEYKNRMKEKKLIYEKYKLNLIETDEKIIKHIDDYLTKTLLKYGVNTL